MPSGPSWPRIAAERYGLDRAKLIEERTHHSTHYFISVDNVRYVLSRVLRAPDRPAFRLQFQIVELLIAAGIASVQPPVPGLNGETYVQQRNHFWFLRRYRHTDTVFWSTSLPLVMDAARTLADLHRAGQAGEAGPPRLDWPRDDQVAPYYWTVGAFLENAETVRRDFDTSALTGDDCDLVDRTLEHLRANAGRILRIAGEFGLRGITHHDYRPDNLLVRNGKVTEVIDWDCAFVDHQLYDVGFAALQFGRRQRLRDDSLGNAKPFIDTYLEHRGIGRLPDDVRWWFLRFVVAKRLLINGSNGERVRLLHAIEEHRPLPAAPQPVGRARPEPDDGRRTTCLVPVGARADS